jgi:hypothetical protein
MDAVLLGAVGTAEEDTIHLHAMTDNPASTMRARRCQRMDGAFEAVEHMRFAILAHFKTFVICIAAYFAFHQPASFSSELIFFGFHSIPLSQLLLILGRLRFLDILPPCPRLGSCRLGTLGNIPPRLGLEAVTANVDWLGPQLLEQIPGLFRIGDQLAILDVSIFLTDQPLDCGPRSALSFACHPLNMPRVTYVLSPEGFKIIIPNLNMIVISTATTARFFPGTTVRLGRFLTFSIGCHINLLQPN